MDKASLNKEPTHVYFSILTSISLLRSPQNLTESRLIPEYLLKIYDTYKKGNTDQAWIEQEAVIGIRSLMKRFPSRSAQKFIFAKISGRESFVRPPLRNLTAEERENLLIIMGEHGLKIETEITI